MTDNRWKTRWNTALATLLLALAAPAAVADGPEPAVIENEAARQDLEAAADEVPLVLVALAESRDPYPRCTVFSYTVQPPGYIFRPECLIPSN